MGMALMLSVVLFIYETDKTRKVILCILSVFVFCNWIGCLSRGGYLGVVVAILILAIIITLRFAFLKKETARDFIQPLLKTTTVVFASLIVLTFILIFSTDNAIRAQFSRLNVNTAEKMATTGTAELPAEIKDVKISSSVIFYSTANADLRIKLNLNNLEFFTGNGIQLRPIFNAGKAAYVFNEQKYSNFKFRLDKNNIIYLFYGDAFIQVAITGQGFKFFDERRGCTEMRKAASWGFKDRERLATNRGYLWSRTIPLLKDSIFLGNGSDTFALCFPQQDYVAKLKYYANPYMIADKPHNMYLQIAMNTGIVSLICVLIIFISYIVTSIKIIFNNNRTTVYSTLSLAAFLGNTAYMVTALFNDSLVSVAPVFWIMLGVGYAVNFVVTRPVRQAQGKEWDTRTVDVGQ
jgi:O-antigen ligase